MVQLTEQQIEDQIDAAIANQVKIDKVEPRANKVLLQHGKIVLNFNNGATFSFFPESIEAISTLPKEVLASVKLTPSGKGLRWEECDIDLSIQGLLLGIFGSNVWIKEVASKGGKVKSSRKAIAAKANGKKGGRPSKD
jgi:hypothetical protein